MSSKMAEQKPVTIALRTIGIVGIWCIWEANAVDRAGLGFCPGASEYVYALLGVPASEHYQ